MRKTVTKELRKLAKGELSIYDVENSTETFKRFYRRLKKNYKLYKRKTA